MSWLRTGWAVSCAVVVGLAAPAAGQTTLLNTAGFEQPTFNPGNIFNQQSFTYTPSNSAGVVQNVTTFAGGQSFQVTGSGLQESSAFSGGNFWYQSFSSGSAYNPLANNTRYVQASAMVRTANTFVNATDIPFAGFHFEAWTTFFGSPFQQALTPVHVSSLGEIQVFSSTATAGSSASLFTASGVMGRDVWQKLAVEFDFQNQTFRVYAIDTGTPVQFIRNGGGQTLPVPIIDVPFRNTWGNSLSIAEQGMVAYSGRDVSNAYFAPGNNFFVDDYLITASGSPQFGNPVPEPGLMVAVGFAALAAGGWMRRRGYFFPMQNSVRAPRM